MSRLPALVRASSVPLRAGPARATRAPTRSGHAVAIEVPHQEQDLWCWCAVTVGVSRFYDAAFGLSQCQTAGHVLQVAEVCGDPSDERVNRLFDLDRSLAAFGRLGGMSDTPLPFAQVMQEIDAGRPVCARLRFMDSGMAHVVAIRGYRQVPQQMLLIDDPLFDESEATYQGFLTAYRGTGRWKQSYLTR